MNRPLEEAALSTAGEMAKAQYVDDVVDDGGPIASGRERGEIRQTKKTHEKEMEQLGANLSCNSFYAVFLFIYSVFIFSFFVFRYYGMFRTARFPQPRYSREMLGCFQLNGLFLIQFIIEKSKEIRQFGNSASLLF